MIDETALGGSLRTFECTGSWITGAFVTCVHGDNALGIVRGLLIFFLTERRLLLLRATSTPSRRRRYETTGNRPRIDNTAAWGPYAESKRVFERVGLGVAGE